MDTESRKTTIGRTEPEATGPGMEEQVKIKAQSLKEEAVDRGRQYLEQRKGTTADLINDFAEAMETAATQLESKDRKTASYYIRTASREMRRWSSSLRDYGLDTIADQVQSFAGRHPGMLLSGAAVAGFAVTRVLRSADRASEPRTSEYTTSMPDSAPLEEQVYSPGAAFRPHAEEFGPHS